MCQGPELGAGMANLGTSRESVQLEDMENPVTIVIGAGGAGRAKVFKPWGFVLGTKGCFVKSFKAMTILYDLNIKKVVPG